MKAKRKNIFANSVMVAIIAMIAVAGVFVAGYILGWFGDKDAYNAEISDIRGRVTITRNGLSFPVEKTTKLREGDAVSCYVGATASLRVDKGSALAIGEQAELNIIDPMSKSFTAELVSGELFAFVPEDGVPIKLRYELGAVDVKNAVISLSAHTGSQTLNVFSGTVNGVESGNALFYVVNQEHQMAPVSLNSLNAFAITQLRAANNVYATAITNQELDELEASREAEKVAQATATMAENLKDLQLDYECTVTIRCDTILDHMDNLTRGKDTYVPKDGIILATVKIPFAENETAFDVTKRACDAYGIHLEYSWTPVYNSHYVEGINNLYEFDCGAQSGWIFKVNGWSPNYGASSYKLQDGDAVAWCFTCEGLGADVGGGTY